MSHRKGLFTVTVGNRLNYFVVGLTNVDPAVVEPVYKQYIHIQYNDVLPSAATGSVSFPPSTGNYRYVIIQQEFGGTDAICMSEVKVFLRGTLAYIISLYNHHFL